MYIHIHIITDILNVMYVNYIFLSGALREIDPALPMLEPHYFRRVVDSGGLALIQKTQQYAQKRVRPHNARIMPPNMFSCSGVGIALCESTVVRDYRC